MLVQGALERARAAKEIGRAEEARRILGAALARASEDPEVLAALGDIAFFLGDLDETLRWAGQAIVIDPDRPAGRPRARRHGVRDAGGVGSGAGSWRDSRAPAPT